MENGFEMYDSLLNDSDQSLPRTNAFSKGKSSFFPDPFETESDHSDDEKSTWHLTNENTPPPHLELSRKSSKSTFAVAAQIKFPAVRSILWDRRVVKDSFSVGIQENFPQMELLMQHVGQMDQQAKMEEMEDVPILLGHLLFRNSNKEVEKQIESVDFVPMNENSGHAQSNVSWKIPVYCSKANKEGIDKKNPLSHITQELYRSILSNCPYLANTDNSQEQNKGLDVLTQPFPIHIIYIPSTELKNMRANLAIEALIPSFCFHFDPIHPLPVRLTPAARRLAVAPVDSAHMTHWWGLVTMDETRKAVPLLESDPLASQNPIVGVWIYNCFRNSSNNIQDHPQIKNALLYYLENKLNMEQVFIEQDHIDKINMSNNFSTKKTFLVLWYTFKDNRITNQDPYVPQFFECSFRLSCKNNINKVDVMSFEAKVYLDSCPDEDFQKSKIKCQLHRNRQMDLSPMGLQYSMPSSTEASPRNDKTIMFPNRRKTLPFPIENEEIEQHETPIPRFNMPPTPYILKNIMDKENTSAFHLNTASTGADVQAKSGNIDIASSHSDECSSCSSTKNYEQILEEQQQQLSHLQRQILELQDRVYQYTGSDKQFSDVVDSTQNIIMKEKVSYGSISTDDVTKEDDRLDKKTESNSIYKNESGKLYRDKDVPTNTVSNMWEEDEEQLISPINSSSSSSRSSVNQSTTSVKCFSDDVPTQSGPMEEVESNVATINFKADMENTKETNTIHENQQLLLVNDDECSLKTISSISDDSEAQQIIPANSTLSSLSDKNITSINDESRVFELSFDVPKIKFESINENSMNSSYCLDSSLLYDGGYEEDDDEVSSIERKYLAMIK